jgi:poly(hydroxyalkanoate) depolymerase family esterase
MNRSQRLGLAIVSIAFALSAAAPARAASLTMVNRSTWTGGANVPSYVQMYIYVPDKLAAKPPILSAHHSCATTDAMYYFGNLPKIKAAADKNGFIIIVPLAMGKNCWDVGTKASLTHDGGGDTQAIAQMVKYTLTKYNGDPGRVYAMGGSSGAMMTQALMAVYPDIFRAGSARAGVPAGCWSDGYDSSMQWSNNCAGGNTKKTPQQWGDGVRAMYPGYNGHRPRLQIFHGTADTTINYNNFGEAIDEWTNVLNLPMTATSMDMPKGSAATWTRQMWKNPCGYNVFEALSASGAGHSMSYEEDFIIAFLGLDKTDGDPEPDCAGGSDGGVGGSGGPGTGGAGGAGTGSGGAAGSAAKGGSNGSAGSAGVAGGGPAGGPGGSSSSGAGGVAGSSSSGVAGGNGVAGSASSGVAGSSSTGVAGSASSGVAGSSSSGVAGSNATGVAGSASSGVAGGNGAAGSGGPHEDGGGTGICSASTGRHGMGALSLLLAAVLGVTRRRRRGAN